MRIGFVLPQIGPLSTPENLTTVAQRAESLGYDSLWVTERLLYPVKPQTPYPATLDGSLPRQYQRVLDPLDTLTFVAGQTKRVALGTSVLDMPFYNPVVLARRLTTIDVLSGGRLRVGLGLGWSKDEYDASGAVAKGRGAYADEFIQVLKAIWTTDPVEFHGKFFHLPQSIIGPKPVQKPHPPIYLAAFAPPALQRLARLADGWNPVGMPAEAMAQTMASLREMARAAGRDPAALKMIVRANLVFSDQPLGNERWIFSGTMEQIKQDIGAVRSVKADELFFDVVFSPGVTSIERFLQRMEQICALV